MLRYIALLSLKITGWKIHGELPEGLHKYVLIAGPHTSNWDLFYGRIFFYVKRIPLKYLIKKELFFFPLNIFLKAIGGIPVDRKKNVNLTGYVASIFNKSKEMALMITPEGTRSYSPNWKKGFYYIAKEANVPVVLGYLDYKKRIIGVGPVMPADESVDVVISRIKEFYIDKIGKYPEKGIY